MLSLVRAVSKLDENFDVRKYKDYDNIIRRKTEPLIYRLYYYDLYSGVITAKIIPRDKKVIKYKAFDSYIENVDPQMLYYEVLLTVNQNKNFVLIHGENEEYNIKGRKIIDINVDIYSKSRLPCTELNFVGEKLKDLLPEQHDTFGKILFFFKDEKLYKAINSQRDIDKLNKLDETKSDPKRKTYYQKDKFNGQKWMTLSHFSFENIYYDLLKNKRCFYAIGYNVNKSEDSDHAIVLTIEFIGENRNILIELIDSNGYMIGFHITFWSKQLMTYLISKGYDVIFKMTTDEPYMPQQIAVYKEMKEMSLQEILSKFASMINEGNCTVYSFYYIWLRIKNLNISGLDIRKYIMNIDIVKLEAKINKLSTYLLGNYEEDEIL